MHKKPYSKQRLIAASGRCTTKPISSFLTKCLRLVENQLRFMCQYYENNYGITPMWILKNSIKAHKIIAKFNSNNSCTKLMCSFERLLDEILYYIYSQRIADGQTKSTHVHIPFLHTFFAKNVMLQNLLIFGMCVCAYYTKC